MHREKCVSSRWRHYARRRRVTEMQQHRIHRAGIPIHTQISERCRRPDRSEVVGRDKATDRECLIAAGLPWNCR